MLPLTKISIENLSWTRTPVTCVKDPVLCCHIPSSPTTLCYQWPAMSYFTRRLSNLGKRWMNETRETAHENINNNRPWKESMSSFCCSISAVDTLIWDKRHFNWKLHRGKSSGGPDKLRNLHTALFDMQAFLLSYGLSLPIRPHTITQHYTHTDMIRPSPPSPHPPIALRQTQGYRNFTFPFKMWKMPCLIVSL